MSGHSPRFDVVASTRRQFSVEQKRAIVAEVESGATVSEVARRHTIHSCLLFRWRRQYASAPTMADARPSKRDAKAVDFLPVRVEEPATSARSRPRSLATHRSALIEIELVRGRKLRIDGDIDVAILKRIIAALETT
jgi:transposase